ncbi:shikimate kinase [Solilutibacter tolerans]|uniref:Shikimate kinase n=2 Tax=Solilutibacter tolerans TaxID=1604334 RepID=A0A1N6U235_9GAMM|nr:shikimate kinase [Lysobacter tolerans]
MPCAEHGSPCVNSLYDWRMDTAANLVLVGPMGAGKSSIGKRLAQALSLEFVDADRVLEARTGASVADIFVCEGEAGFRRRESALLQELLAGQGQLIATGGGVVLSDANRALLSRDAFVVHLDVSVTEQLRRLARDRTRPLLQRDDREEVLHVMATDRAPLYAEVADLHLDTDGCTPDQACRMLLPCIQNAWRGVAA